MTSSTCKIRLPVFNIQDQPLISPQLHFSHTISAFLRISVIPNNQFQFLTFANQRAHNQIVRVSAEVDQDEVSLVVCFADKAVDVVFQRRSKANRLEMTVDLE